MHSRFRAKGVTLTVLVALFALLAIPGALMAKPRPGEPGRGFRLQARATGAITVNRVYCGIAAGGEVCVDSLNSSTIGGGYWPKGSPMQYVFNSGLQAAGIIDAASGGVWGDDTVGALFFSARGGNQGSQVEPIWNSSDANDRAAWPAAGLVPQGDAVADLFNVNLQGRVSASEADIWTLAWDGDPGAGSGRVHPMGIAVETRGLGWNFPTGNEDIVYFIYTFYNISSSCAADYVNIRPTLRGEIQALGTQFQTLNNAKSGIVLPACGYTIKNFYANFAADMDVADAGLNYASVNIPFALGYAYEDVFDGPPGTYRLPADIAKPGFLPGFGFVGVKYLKSPVVAGVEVGISLFSNTTNGGAFPDPQSSQQLWRYLSGNISSAQGDGACNYVPTVDKICYINKATHSDVRFYQSSGPFDLAPGEFGSVVVGYLFASAVAVPGCPNTGCTPVKPGEPLLLSNPVTLAANGANLIDSLTGFNGYADLNADGIVQQDEFKPVKGSLLDKALVAQAVFNSGFLLPSPPAPPEFFLVPGSNQVAIFWRPTVTEADGDLYFGATSLPLNPDLTVNALYDPNYRQYDVEGYRIYRGRVDDPRSLTMLAQYDIDNSADTAKQFKDYLGVVNPTPDCAPELRDLAGDPVLAGCLAPFDTAVAAGTAYTTFQYYDIVSPFIQVKLGDRTMLANGDALVIKADTAVTGALTTFRGTELSNTGIPLVYVDKTAKNNIRYFYTVTAFDVNSVQSGPSSLESARVTKSATPVLPAGNYDNAGAVSIGIFGRGVNMSVAIPRTPSINGTTGRFSGPARPATGALISFVGDFVKQVITQSGEMSLALTAVRAGSAYDFVATEFDFDVTTAVGVTNITLPVVQDQFDASVSTSGTLDNGSIDGERGARYGGDTTYHVVGQYSLEYAGNWYTGSWGRGCANGSSDPAAPFVAGKCAYNGVRWFEGANETFDHPTRGNTPNNSGSNFTNATNAGQVNGVANIWEARSYETRPNTYRTVEGVIGGSATAADYKVWWSTTVAGAVDSVVDITHNVRVPFDTTAKNGYTWGFLTQAGTNAAGSGDGRPGVLTVTDLGCVNPLHSFAAPNAHLGCLGTTHFVFSNSVTLGPVTMGNTVANDGVKAAQPNPGFGMYLAGHFFLFEMAPAAPAPGGTSPAVVWTLRSYVGTIGGGGGSVGSAGNLGAYSFTPIASPLTAPGASLKAAYSVSNALRPTSEADLSRVHTVPDPYYVMNGYERTATGKVIKFVNLPDQAVVRIYSVSGVLVRVLQHTTTTFNGSLDWDVRNRNNQIVASGVYFYHIESPSGARRVGRMTIVNFAQ